MPPTAQAAPFDAAAEPSDAGTDADPPDAE